MRWKPLNQTNNPQLRKNAQKLRREMTKEERRLWYDFLKQLPVTINRQKVIAHYIVDFYCASAKLVIELDGSQHYEDEGAAYSPHGSAGMTIKGDKPFLQALTYVNMKPEKKDLVVKIMRESLSDIANGQIEADALQKIKEKMLKDYDTNAKSNGHWISVLNMYNTFNIDTQNGYKEAVNKVTADDVSKFVKETLVKTGNCIEVTMNPTDAPAAAKEAPATAKEAKPAAAKKATAKKAAKKTSKRKR